MTNSEILNETHFFNDQIIFHCAQQLDYGKFHIKIDNKTGLHAIVAIHSTKRGPALGGCRLIEYPTIGAAFNDAIRLGHGMTYKAALHNLPLGGGKAVLLKPDNIPNRKAYFAAFGEFVHSLGGQYITAMDSGTVTEDMDVISTKTPYVTCTQDPSPYTALGVIRGIEAAVKFRLKKDNLKGIHVAVQGLGHVGYDLCQTLIQLGANVTACDADPIRAKACAQALPIDIVSPENIYDVGCDVFSPCALGGILNDSTIHRLRMPIVAGAANNQLEKPEQGEMLHLRGILYAPDYAINAGGLIFACAQYAKTSLQTAKTHTNEIYQTLTAIFERSQTENCPTSTVADRLAEERLI